MAELSKSTERKLDALPKAAAELSDSADRRTQLAADRTVMAAERTYVSWVQLGLASFAAGLGAKRLLAGVVPEWMILLQGTLLVLFSSFCFGAAVWRQISPGVPPPRPDVRRLPAHVLIAINGFLAIVSLTALLSVWFGESGGK